MIPFITITRVSDLIVQYLYHDNISIIISLVFYKFFNIHDPIFFPLITPKEAKFNVKPLK